MPNGQYSPRCAATCTASWEYRQAQITFNMPLLAAKKEEEIEEIIVHEMVHVLVNEMREKGIKHEERVVTELTWAFRDLTKQYENLQRKRAAGTGRTNRVRA